MRTDGAFIEAGEQDNLIVQKLQEDPNAYGIFGFSYLDQKNLSSEDGIQVEINGDLFNCSIIKEPLYDPSGEKMRG